MMLEAEDVNFVLYSAVKVALSTLIIPAINSPANFYAPLLCCWVSYFVLGGFLSAYLERNKQYYIIKMNWTRFDLYAQAGSSARDLFVVLPTVLWLTHRYNLFTIVLTNPVEVSAFYQSPIPWVMIPGAIIVGLVWRMTMHRLLHHPRVYRLWHKIHHVRPECMTPFSSFNDHPVEFLIMEVVGTFYIPVVLNPLPIPVLCAVWSWQCFSGILDHCNATIPGSYFVDAEYHLTHHQLTVYNYAEFEILDKVVGTLYSGDTKWRNETSTFESIDNDKNAGSFDFSSGIGKTLGGIFGSSKKNKD